MSNNARSTRPEKCASRARRAHARRGTARRGQDECRAPPRSRRAAPRPARPAPARDPARSPAWPARAAAGRRPARRPAPGRRRSSSEPCWRMARRSTRCALPTSFRPATTTSPGAGAWKHEAVAAASAALAVVTPPATFGPGAAAARAAARARAGAAGASSAARPSLRRPATSARFSARYVSRGEPSRPTGSDGGVGQLAVVQDGEPAGRPPHDADAARGGARRVAQPTRRLVAAERETGRPPTIKAEGRPTPRLYALEQRLVDRHVGGAGARRHVADQPPVHCRSRLARRARLVQPADGRGVRRGLHQLRRLLPPRARSPASRPRSASSSSSVSVSVGSIISASATTSGK